MSKKKTISPQEVEKDLQKIKDLFSRENKREVRIDLLRSLRETRDTICGEMEGIETLSTSTLFLRPEEKVHLRDSLALLRHTLLSLDTAIYTLEENLKGETGGDSQTETPSPDEKTDK